MAAFDARQGVLHNQGAYNPHRGLPPGQLGIGQTGHAALSSGPGRLTTDDPFGAGSPLIEFFGHPNVPLESNPYLRYNRENYDYPEAWNGHNPFISLLLITKITEEDVWPLREALPLKKYEGGIQISWEITTFNDHLLDRTPEQGVSRMLTSNREGGSDFIVRHGLQFEVEHGFWQTPRGQQHYVAQIQQIKNATICSMTLGVAEALLNAGRRTYSREAIVPYGLSSVSAVEAAIQLEVDQFAILSKSQMGYDEMVTAMDNLMHQRVGKPCNHFSGAPGFLSYFRSNPAATWFVVAGPENMSRSQQEMFSKITDGRVFREWPSIPVAENRRVNPLIRPRTTCAFIQMNELHLRDIPSDQFKVEMLDTYIYDEQTDSEVRISYKEALQSVGLYPRNGDGSIDEDNFTEFGHEFFETYDTWGDYLQSTRQLDRFAAAFLAKQNAGQRTRSKFMEWEILKGAVDPAVVQRANQARQAAAAARPRAGAGAGAGAGAQGRAENILRRVQDGLDLKQAFPHDDPPGSTAVAVRREAEEAFERDRAHFRHLAATFEADIRQAYETIFMQTAVAETVAGGRRDISRLRVQLPRLLAFLEHIYSGQRDLQRHGARGYTPDASNELVFVLSSLAFHEVPQANGPTIPSNTHPFYNPAFRAVFTENGSDHGAIVSRVLEANQNLAVTFRNEIRALRVLERQSQLRNPSGHPGSYVESATGYRAVDAPHNGATAILATSMGTDEQVKNRLRNLRIRDFPSFLWWALRNDMPPLVRLAGYRQPEHEMCYAFGIRAFGEAGNTYYGRSDFQLADNAIRKVHQGHYTLYFKSLVLNDRAVVVMPAVHPTGGSAYLGGNNSRIADVMDVDDADEHTVIAERRDLRFIPMHLDESITSVNWDITGLYHKDLGMPGADSFPRMAQTYARHRRVFHGPTNPLEATYAKQEAMVEPVTIARQDYQVLYNYLGAGRGEWSRVVKSRTHWGPHVYAGCGAVRRGARKFFEIPNYSETRTTGITFTAS